MPPQAASVSASSSSAPSALLRQYSKPLIITSAALALAYIAYRYTSQPPSRAQRGLRRSNARRVSRREPPAEVRHITEEELRGLLEATGQSSFGNEDGAFDALAELLPHQDNSTAEERQNQNLLNLLYHIAEDNAKREGYIHRGVTCNSCSTQPIRGVRYRCSNCVDFDLCEHCEAMDAHPKTHLFFKVRIPAPFLGNPRQVLQPWYPGKPNLCANSIPPEVMAKLQSETRDIFEQQEIEALYEQFKCLAATEFPTDPLGFNGAISRPTFDKCFIPVSSQRPPGPNLVYDRMFDFYDQNGDGLIDFREFLLGLAALSSKSKTERLKRIFKGYDFDNDGYITRDDFLKMFRAYYALSKDLAKDTVALIEDDIMDPAQMTEHILGSQPISAAFTGSIPMGGQREPKPDNLQDLQHDGPVVQPSGSDTLRPGETITMSSESRQRAMRRDIGIIGLSGSEPATVFPSREMEEGQRVFENWVEGMGGDVRSERSREDEVAGSMIAQPSASVRPDDTDEPGTSERDFIEEEPSTSERRPFSASSPVRPPSSPPRSIPETDAISSHPGFPTSPTGSFSIPSLPPSILPDTDHENPNANPEILYEITKQGMNELLDLIFKEREKEAAKARKRKEREEKRRRRKAEKEGKEVPPQEEKKDKDEASGSGSPETEEERKGISYEEFERIMLGENGRKLGFIGAWVEMASF